MMGLLSFYRDGAHAFLEPYDIRSFFRCGRLTELLPVFCRPPAPMIDTAISKGQIGTLVVTVRWKITPELPG